MFWLSFFFRKKIVLSNKNIISSNHSCFGLREESSASLRGKEQCQPPQRSGRVRKAGHPTILQAEPNFSGGSSENSGFDSALSAWSWCLGCCQAPSVCKPMVPCFLRPDKVRAHSKKGIETCNLFEKKKKNTNKSISWGSQIKAQRPLLVLGQQQLLMQAWRPSSSGQGALGFRAAVCFKASPLSREKQSPENALAGFLDALSQCSPAALAAAQALLLSHGHFSG